MKSEWPPPGTPPPNRILGTTPRVGSDEHPSTLTLDIDAPMEAAQDPRLSAVAATLLLVLISAVPLLLGGWAIIDEVGAAATEGQSRAPVEVDVDAIPRTELRALSRLPAASSIPVVYYHGIGEGEDRYSISPREFARHMLMLHDQGFQSVGMGEYVRARQGHRQGLPRKPILITFDDGRLDSFTGSDAVLRALGFRATMFVVTASHDDPGSFALSWPELRGMHASGVWDIQLHAAEGHSRIAVDASGRRGYFYVNREVAADGRAETFKEYGARVTRDLKQGRDTLKREIPGASPLAFAFPFGSYGQNGTNDDRIPPFLRSLVGATYPAVFVTEGRAEVPARESAMDAIERFEITSGTSAEDLHRRLQKYYELEGRHDQ